MPRSKKSKPYENNSPPEPAALEASTEFKESKEPRDLPMPQRQMTPTIPKSETTPNNSFEDFYLQQITHEFADDLDKIRKASDFKEKSLPVLVAALKQGASIYTEEERRDWLGHTAEKI